tara:strand:+ start:27 stop:215 length:189 start_codon:yes stop_codon:yes gene_type:complete
MKQETETEINKENFLAYKKVQESGITNMLDINRVSGLSGLDPDTIMEIIKNYNKLSEVYKDG